MSLPAWTVGVALLMCSAVVQSATLTGVPLKDGRVAISLTGEIVPGDAEALKSLIKKANDTGKLVASIRLDSEGGNLGEAVEIAAVVQFGKLNTVIVSNAKCASACFVVFAAGAEKYANYSSTIGVHGASDQQGRETVTAGAATVVMARVIKQLGVPAGIIGKMVVTPPDQMVWLSPADLRSMGTTLLGKPAQVPPEPPSARGQPLDLSPQSQARITPSQTAPVGQVPQQRTTTDTEQGKKPPDWETLVKVAVQLSLEQNNGKLKNVRTCQPEFKICIDGLPFRGKDGVDYMIRREEDMNGKTLRRELCSFNSDFDVRRCIDWDSGAVRRDMKDGDGRWQKIADQ
jgi:hypothetical protein